MSGMDTGTNMFQSENMALARAYWYIIAGVLGLLVVIRAANFYGRHQRYADLTCSLTNKQTNTKTLPAGYGDAPPRPSSSQRDRQAGYPNYGQPSPPSAAK